VAVGLLGVRATGAGREHVGCLVAALVGLSMAPDLDVIGFRLGIPYGAPWGHRGATHSLAMALGMAIATALFLRRTHAFRRLAPIAVAVAVSHGLLDAMTDGGHGVALLWPWTPHRFFFAWRPIPVAPIGMRLLSAHGLGVVFSETVAFAPAWILALWPSRGDLAAGRGRRPSALIVASGAACGLLVLDAFEVVLPATADVRVFLAAPCAFVIGIAAATVVSASPRHRALVAPLVGIVATAVGFGVLVGLDSVASGSRPGHALSTMGSDVLARIFVGFYGFGFLGWLTVPIGAAAGSLLGVLVGDRVAARTEDPPRR
jgi:inner membrane protein